MEIARGETMLNKISERFYGWAKGWLILILLILDVFFGIRYAHCRALMQDGSGLIQPLDLMMFATPDKLFAMIEKYGEFSTSSTSKWSSPPILSTPLFIYSFSVC